MKTIARLAAGSGLAILLGGMPPLAAGQQVRLDQWPYLIRYPSVLRELHFDPRSTSGAGACSTRLKTANPRARSWSACCPDHLGPQQLASA